MTYIQKGFKAYDNRKTAQGADQQEGKFPFTNKEGDSGAKAVDEEGNLITESAASTVNTDSGFNPAATTIARASQASKAAKAPASSQAISSSARFMQPKTNSMNPMARKATSASRGKVSGDLMTNLSLKSNLSSGANKGGEIKNWYSRWLGDKNKNLTIAQQKFQTKGSGDANSSANTKPINAALGVNLNQSS
tara:strand:+ start:295 stop:873 length:579 start_codon:yes stop_codon:yes gene_type:complete